MHWMRYNVFNGKPNAGQSLLIGAAARTFAGSVMIPFTVVKTRFYLEENRTFTFTTIRIESFTFTTIRMESFTFTFTTIRMESGAFQYRSVFTALSSILCAEGLRGLTRGLGPTLARDVPFSRFELY